ncbi:thermonuclease family protein [Mycolicibacterium celeriflavum]|uniref:thermonuclease family protein n=1 Tax=Mycolicibacterium celeriflavum TaxID=1249101 RepID=UPI0009ED9C13|nr:thermonuclease family protein [Mycolicibacterium celeriflavum]
MPLLVASPDAHAEPVNATAVVLEVVDGDTIDIRDENRGNLRVRVLGIDTPETKKPGAPVECWGPEATEYATANLLGNHVAFVPDATQDRTDRYGRTLAYIVRADGWDYSVEAARAGAARAYVYGGTPVARYDAIAAAEAEAKAAQRGLWGSPCFGRTAASSDITSAPAPASPAPLTGPPPASSAASPPPPSSLYYGNCAAVRRAGAAPLMAGEPGYRADLDADGDGVACVSPARVMGPPFCHEDGTGCFRSRAVW